MALVLVVSASALARGSVRVSSATVDEDDGRWKLKFTIDYGAEPHLAHIPMIFSFKQTAVYERSLTDDSPDKPVERKVAVQNATPINLPMDVGFADMTGKMFKVTKFTMELTREREFEAGEYELTVKLAQGGVIGNKMRLYLKGNNKAIDRRAMVFTAEAPKKKKTDEPKDMAASETDNQPKAAEDYGTDLSDIEDISQEEADAIEDPSAPGKVPPKQGGCGCRVAGAPAANGLGAALLLIGLAAAAGRRRSRRAAA